MRCLAGIPTSKRSGLVASQFAQGYVSISLGQIYAIDIGLHGCIPRDVACALAMPNDRQFPRPVHPNLLFGEMDGLAK